MSEKTTKWILSEIDYLHNIQKRNSPKTSIWKQADTVLMDLFAEMARRTGS